MSWPRKGDQPLRWSDKRTAAAKIVPAAERFARLTRQGEPSSHRVLRYDQAQVLALAESVRRGEASAAFASRILGCHPSYITKRAWRLTRAVIIERDLHCVRCAGPGNQVHHRAPRGMGGAGDWRITYGLANLVFLCGPCHAWVESNRAQAQALGYLVRRGFDPAEVPVQLGMARSWFLLTEDGERLNVASHAPRIT